jgi:hypothetical protein
VKKPETFHQCHLVQLKFKLRSSVLSDGPLTPSPLRSGEEWALETLSQGRARGLSTMERTLDGMRLLARSCRSTERYSPPFMSDRYCARSVDNAARDDSDNKPSSCNYRTTGRVRLSS